MNESLEKMKRAAAVLLAGTLLAGCFAGCSGKNPDATGEPAPSETPAASAEPAESAAPEASAKPEPTGPAVNEAGFVEKQDDPLPYTKPGKDYVYKAPAVEEIKTPAVIETIYPTDDVVIADFVVTNEAFGADNTGEKDSRAAIQKAIDACAAAGGGTVWMPAGKYRISGTVNIKSFVTLRGDWQDPDLGNEYGTIILADVKPGEGNKPALFTIGGCAGAMGLTVYYPHQDIGNVQKYPFTFYVDGRGDRYMLQTIQNCTVLNGYRGVGCCVDEKNAHEMLTVDNLKGTFLYNAAEVYNQADVGTWKNVTVNNQYWANCGAGLDAPERSAIDEYTRQRATALILGDLEWTEFENLRIADCNIGIRVVKGKRIEFAGSLYDVDIRRCNRGLRVESFDQRWGMLIARSYIEGSAFCVENISRNKGVIKVCDVEFKGEIPHKKLIQTEGNLEKYAVDTDYKPAKPNAGLHVIEADKTGKTDISAVLQSALDEAGKKGGVVYLPAGLYRLEKPVTVPAGVELRGSGSVPTREQSGNSSGTLILAYYGYNDRDPQTAPALVTLSGDKAGLRNIRFIYPENNPATPGREGTVRKCNFCVRAVGDSCYAVNVCIVAAYNGMDFDGCDNHLIKRYVGCTYNKHLRVANSKGGMIEECLFNGNNLPRNGLRGRLPDFENWITEDKIFDWAINPVTRRGMTYITLDRVNGETVLNTFAYGAHCFLESVSSRDVFLCNVGADNVGDGSPMMKFEGGSAVGVNIMRWNGISYKSSGTDLELYTRITIGEQNEPTVLEGKQ